jgi:hypothetical protein
MSGGQEDLNAPADMKEVIDEKQGSILLGIIKQLRIGMDLTRVTLPTFILEPRSLLERMSDFMIHKDLLLRYSTIFFLLGLLIGMLTFGCQTKIARH